MPEPTADTEPIPDTAPLDDLPDANYDLIFLDAKTVKLFRTGGSIVRAVINDPNLGPERSYIRVQIARAFPFSMPDRYIGLRDGRDKDIGMLVTLDGMDPETRAIVDEELARRYFIPVIARVNNVREEFGTTTWDVETDKGPREFAVQNLRDSVQDLSPTRLIITDVDGNRYEFPDVRTLDEKSLTVLQRVL